MFDSLGLLLMYAERDRVARFLHWLSSALRTQSVCGVFGLAAGVTAEETRQSLAQAFDRQILWTDGSAPSPANGRIRPDRTTR